jgi:hypothetical protein
VPAILFFIVTPQKVAKIPSRFIIADCLLICIKTKVSPLHTHMFVLPFVIDQLAARTQPCIPEVLGSNFGFRRVIGQLV